MVLSPSGCLAQSDRFDRDTSPAPDRKPAQVLTESGKVGFTLSRGRTLEYWPSTSAPAYFTCTYGSSSDQQWYADNPGWPEFAVAHSSAIERFLRRLVHQLIRIGLVSAVAALRGAITSKATIIKRLTCVGSPEIISLYPQVQWFHYTWRSSWRIATILIVIAFTTERN